MPARYTVIVDGFGGRHKVAKIWFGSDGSYYVSPPYHGVSQALLACFTVNYARQEQNIALSEVIDSADLEDERRALKLSHHPDGFIQFSGSGVLSGRDDDGNPKGIGTMSWPLRNPTQGPSFALAMFNVSRYSTAPNEDRPNDITFAAEEIVPVPGWTSLHVEGYYLPPLWRRFVQRTQIGKVVQLAHPSRAILTLRIIEAPYDCAIPGLIGLECYTDFGEFDTASDQPGLLLSGSTGNLRRNEDGELLGDGIYAIIPPASIEGLRSGNYTQPAPPYATGSE